jgi:DNA (cytosine-5)-methyltransferase 1
VREPIPTVATSGAISVTYAFTVPMNRSKDRLRSVDEPVQTVTATSSDLGLVEPFIATVSHGADKSRCRSLSDPLPTITGANDHAVVEPFTVKFDHARSNTGRARSIDSPLPTITTKNGLGIVAPMIVEMRNGKTASSIDQPLSTVTTLGAHHALVDAQPFLAKFYGTGSVASIDEPLDTVTARDRFGLCEAGDMLLYDIRFRMLQPRELARAQGFPDHYQFSGTKAEVTKLIGNAVPVSLAEALCRELLA